MNIEDTIFDEILPVNTKPILNRMRKLLDDNKTNSLYQCKENPRIKKLMWLLNSQFYGQLTTINMIDEWQKLKTKEISHESQ